MGLQQKKNMKKWTEEKYEEVDTWNSSILEWCINFFDKFLKGLEETNPLITIYETHSLD